MSDGAMKDYKTKQSNKKSFFSLPTGEKQTFFFLSLNTEILLVLAVSHVAIVQRDTGACACLTGLGESEEFGGLKNGVHCSVHVL